MSQHLADSLYGYSGFQSNQRSEEMSSGMVGQIFLDVGENRKAFHQATEIGVVQHWKKCWTDIVVVFLYQFEGFGQEFDTGLKFVFFATVFEP